MAEATQYLLSLQEITELIIKKQDIHEGVWTITLGVQVGTGGFGPLPDQQFPGAAVTVTNVGIQKVDGAAPLGAHLIIDAAKINPKQAGKKKST